MARRVEPGHEAASDSWAKGILDSAATFPGHRGYGLFTPFRWRRPWFLVHRFRDAEACRAWQDSPERAARFADCQGHGASPGSVDTGCYAAVARVTDLCS
ncbi:antibiotic biosynthesis monooxygenase [Streptomyces sp. NBC_00057]|uniref:antibiotic biosynthesis monooxygenase n=1 Tax=Streptomyces sp. NBC_00057 TaxID=2975634 RepID=UPI003253BCEE